MSDLLKKIRTQDNRCTKLPIYYVIKRKQWVPCWKEQCDKYIWVDKEGKEFHNHEALLDHLVKHEHICAVDRQYLAFENDFSEHGIDHVPVKYEEYESESDPIFLTEESAKSFCENDRDKTAVTYVKHAGRELEELIGLAERAEKAEAYCLRMCEAVKKHRDKFLDKSYCHPVTDYDIDLYDVLNSVIRGMK